MYPIKRVNPDLAENIEPLGTKRKYWYREQDVRTLFKAEERGTGEDWAEKICCELAELLGLPHVHYELAIEDGTNNPGVVCSSCVVRPESLFLGNQLMLALDKKYPADLGPKFKVKAHTVEAVSDAVRLISVPDERWTENVPDEANTSCGIFTGYILLDALTANQDRHHENWGVVWDGQTMRLAPSFDHGAALARNLADTNRKLRLESPDPVQRVPAFAARARSAFYAENETKRPMSTYHAWRAFADLNPDAAKAWQSRLAAIDRQQISAIIERIPPSRMSAICRRFTQELIEENQKRILQNE